MKRRAYAFGNIAVFFLLGFLFPRFYLVLWGVGLTIGFGLLWPELMAGYSGRAERTLRMRKKKGGTPL